MDYYLVNARIFDGIDEVIESGVIEIKNGSIVSVGKGSVEATFTNGTVAIDLKGFTVTPGLIDAHTHLIGGDVVPNASDYASSRRVHEPIGLQAFRTLAAAQKTLKKGFTSVRDMSGRDYLDVQLSQAIDNGIVVGPTIKATGLGLTITGGHVHSRCVEVDGPEEVRKEIRNQIKQGVHWIKLMGVTGGLSTVGRHPLAPQFTREEILAATQEAHRAGIKLAAHAHGQEGILNAVECGIDSVEHGLFLDEKTADLMAEKGVFLVPTLMNDLKYQQALESGVAPPKAIKQRQRLTEEGNPIPSPEERIALAKRHGVRIIAGTDAGGNALVKHGDNAEELVMLVRAGLSNTEALAAATGHAAEAIGLPRRGRIKAGYKADLLISENDVITDVGFLTNAGGVAAVVKDGQVVQLQDISGPLAKICEVLQV